MPAPNRNVTTRYGRISRPPRDIYNSSANLAEFTEPRTFKEAMESDRSIEWKAASDSEFKSLTENKTWDLVELPDEEENRSHVNGSSK